MCRGQGRTRAVAWTRPRESRAKVRGRKVPACELTLENSGASLENSENAGE